MAEPDDPDTVEDRPAEPEPAPPEMVEVEITVAGHTIAVKAHAPMQEVAAQALDLYRKTRLAAKKIPFGFDSTASQVEAAPSPSYVGNLEEGEDDDARLGRVHTQGQPAV